MIRSDAEITEFVLKNCNTNFTEEFIKKLSSNSQTSRLSTKYEMIETAMTNNYENKKIEYTKEQLDNSTSKAYIYAKMVSGKFLDIRPRVDSTEVLEYIISNYEDGYKYMLEALFMKLGLNSISGYVKAKIEGNSFFTKIVGVTNSQPTEMVKRNANTPQINKIKNLIFEVRAKEEETRWLNARIERKNMQKANDNKQYNLNYAQ